MAAFCTASCTVGGKEYSPFPNLAFFDSFQNADVQTRTADQYVEERFLWWENYDDPILNNLISKMLKNNLNLKAAGERVIQAKETIAVTRSSLFPSLSLGGSAARQKTPSGGGAFPTVSQNNAFYSNNYDLGLDAQWQVDLFGQIRNNVNARTASYLSVQANREALVHSLIVQMVEARVALANLYARQDIVTDTITSREKTLETVNRRYELGVASVDALQVRLARENLASAKTQLPPLKTAIREAQYAIDLLIGAMPSEPREEYMDRQIALLPPPARLSLPPPVKMLDTRPDLRVQEYLLYAANNDINAALADLYPSVSIAGGYGFQSRDLGDLIDMDAIAWNLIANLTQPLFEGGNIRANIRLQESEAREISATYAQSIITAVSEVENALTSEENLREQLEALTLTNDEASKAYDLADTRYQKGLIPLTDLLEIERRVLSQQLQILELQQAVWQARLQLYLATGGNWLAKDGTYTIKMPDIKTETLDRA